MGSPFGDSYHCNLKILLSISSTSNRCLPAWALINLPSILQKFQVQLVLLLFLQSYHQKLLYTYLHSSLFFSMIKIHVTLGWAILKWAEATRFPVHCFLCSTVLMHRSAQNEYACPLPSTSRDAWQLRLLMGPHHCLINQASSSSIKGLSHTYLYPISGTFKVHHSVHFYSKLWF